MSEVVINEMTWKGGGYSSSSLVYNFEVKKNVNKDAFTVIEKAVFCFLSLVDHVHLQM
jgi:hypothetical protein